MQLLDLNNDVKIGNKMSTPFFLITTNLTFKIGELILAQGIE